VLETLFDSAGPLVLTAREALEAALIVGVIAAYLKKSGRSDLNRYLYIGVVGAVFASLALGASVLLFYGALSGVMEELFAGATSFTAAIVLTYMIFWMARNSRKVKGEIEAKVDYSLSTGYLLGVAVLSFVAVAREGLETVLFLSAFAIRDITSTVIGTIIGTAVVVALSITMMKGIYRLNVSQFFKYTSIILVVFAAGLAAGGVHEFAEAAEDSGLILGPLFGKAYDLGIPDQSLWGSEGAIGSVLNAIAGYRTSAEWALVLVYLGYWFIVGSYVFRTYWPAVKK